VAVKLHLDISFLAITASTHASLGGLAKLPIGTCSWVHACRPVIKGSPRGTAIGPMVGATCLKPRRKQSEDGEAPHQLLRLELSEDEAKKAGEAGVDIDGWLRLLVR